MADITITKINDVWMKVVCTETYMEMDIQDKFSFVIPNFQHDPRVRSGKWDGVKKLYNRVNKRMYVGLLYELMKFCEKQDFSFYIDPALIPSDDTLEDEDIIELVKLFNPHSEGVPIEPYDYQFEAVKYMLNMNRTTVLAATSAGKSLILYLLIRTYQLMPEFAGKRIVITVPSKSLVEQMFNDFDDYSSFEGSSWNVRAHCQKITGDYDKNLNKQVIISTWQSLSKMPDWTFEDIGAIFIDETHTASAAVLGKILESCIQTPIRHGMTGTLDGIELNELVIQGLLGPVKRVVTAKELIDAGRATDVHIHMSILKWPEESRKELYDKKSKIADKRVKYQTEVDFIYSNEARTDFILSMVNAMPGNSLVIFDLVEDYGKVIYEKFLNDYQDRENVSLIVGGVSADDREVIRTGVEGKDDEIIFCSFGTMSTGVSIKKLHNLFIISSSKAKIRILQTIGRMMRLHASKDYARVFDIVDEISYEGQPNYVMIHANKRMEYYTSEQFKIKFDQYDLV